MPSISPLTARARSIWQAGVDAVDSQRLVTSTVMRTDGSLRIGSEKLDLNQIRRIVVVGAGKAGAGMAAGLETALGDEVVQQKVTGWVNVPADCVRPLSRIVLHSARPAGLNEPTEAGVAGSAHILKLVGELTADDVCIVLISGGGSALLPAPIPEISLSEKLAVTRILSQAGATIQELNAVRTRLSRIKGGGLLRAIPAGKVFVLIISDVIGDPLDVIASGPTISNLARQDPLQILQHYCPERKRVPESVWHVLERPGRPAIPSRVVAQHLVIGNNLTALDAAKVKACELGYHVIIHAINQAGIAREVGTVFAEACLSQSQSASTPTCLLSGGEPVVQLVSTTQSRRGGRNQELVLAAAVRLWQEDLSRLSLLSGGTDGEDGPTDAAGAWFDADVRQRALELHLNPQDFLAINNTYPFFVQAQGLLMTGPTHTNVMDLRVGLIAGHHS